MHYKPKSTAGLQIALGGLSDMMRVQVDPGISIVCKNRRRTSANVNLAKQSGDSDAAAT